MGTPTIGLDIDEGVRCQLSEVERRLREVLADLSDQRIAAGATHLINAGGKRLRPLLALLGAQFGDPERPGVIDAAVITELVHVATLYHDDVLDAAPVRHGVPSANVVWGNRLAVQLGDLLLAKAAELSAGLGLAALRLQTGTLERLVRGQLLETVPVELAADPMDRCLAVMADKSGSLIAMAAQLGAVVAGAESATVAALGRYGENVGLAFQICDDVIDICSPSTESGKTPGTDLMRGVLTVPVLHALAADDATARRLRVILDTGGAGAAPPGTVSDTALVTEALELLRSSVGPAMARSDMHRHADAARAELATLPAAGHAAIPTLHGLCDFVVNRTS